MMSATGKAAARNLVLLAEDLARTRQWLTAILQKAFPDTEILACNNLSEAFAQLAALHDSDNAGRLWLAVIDINLPDGSGIELVREITAAWPDTLAVIATMYDDDAHLMDAIGAGAKGYLLKGEEADVLVGYLRRLTAGEPAMSPSIAHRILAHFREMAEQKSPAPPLRHQQALSPRETEVLALLGKGFTVAETARRLELSPQTVSTYVRTIYSKLSVSNRAQATLEARRRGL
jgi:DNA-binding NarL/FixJ family response regulator